MGLQFQGKTVINKVIAKNPMVTDVTVVGQERREKRECGVLL